MLTEDGKILGGLQIREDKLICSLKNPAVTNPMLFLCSLPTPFRPSHGDSLLLLLAHRPPRPPLGSPWAVPHGAESSPRPGSSNSKFRGS